MSDTCNAARNEAPPRSRHRSSGEGDDRGRGLGGHERSRADSSGARVYRRLCAAPAQHSAGVAACPL
eukprot:5588947-Pleurochrysis_carterae.AAC.1